jgi:hypothetical protein
MDEEQKEFHRNLPSDEGRRKDPHRREESGQQPGVQTYSSSDTDGSNQNLTKTAGEGFREESFGENADPTFEETDNRDGKESK